MVSKTITLEYQATRDGFRRRPRVFDRRTMWQFARFVVVGGLNTALDFTVLNGLILLFGLGQSDLRYVLFKALSFAVAVSNSFLLNKTWVFKRGVQSKRHVKSELGKFLAVSSTGLLINSGVAYAAYSALPLFMPELSTHAVANAAAVIGTIVVILFDFIGYKLIVFRK